MIETRIVNMDGIEIHVEVETRPKPALLWRVVGMAGLVLLLAAPPVGAVVLIISAAILTSHRLGEKTRIDTTVREAAEQAVEKYDHSRILAYKTL